MVIWIAKHIMNNTGFIDLYLSFYFLLDLECKVFRDGQRFFEILFVDFVSVAATFHLTYHRYYLFFPVGLVVTASYIAFLQVFLGGAFAKNQNMCPLLTIVQSSCCAVAVIDNWNVVKEDGRKIPRWF